MPDRGLLRKSPATRGDANVICFLLAVIISILFLTLLMSISSPSARGNGCDLITLLFRVFRASYAINSRTRLRNREVSISPRSPIVRYLYKFIKGE